MNQLDMYKLKSNTKLYSSGFTLLEILVAIIVLSFGLLGMVGIQAMALKSNADAKQQSEAVRLAGELSDMMRGNKSVAVTLTTTANPYLIDDFIDDGTPITAPSEYCSVSPGCSSSFKVAEWEKYDWLNRIQSTFPRARVQVCYDDAPYTTSGIPQWGCSGGAAARGFISIKMGWTRESNNKTRVKTANVTTDATTNADTAFDKATKPSVIYVVTPGSSGV